MIYGEGNSPAEIHGTQLRQTTDSLVYRTDRLDASIEWSVRYGEQLLAYLLELNSQTADALEQQPDQTAMGRSESSTL